MRKELSSKYEHSAVELQEKYQNWIKEGYYTAGDEGKYPFCIVIPPPNVTGKLHLGHAWDTTLQDLIARYERMKGKDMLWLSGMDHAGIATQAKVDERLKKEGISRYDLGREGFLERAWQWKEEYASHIREQWSKMGLSLDYSRERFTLDEGLSNAVKKVFVDYYNDGLIYQGERIINWDPKAKTALSNIEVIHKEVEGAMYTFNYQVKDSDESFHVATTRPETMFGDVCVVVHPKDERYQHLIGQKAINPANHQEIDIIADDYIDVEFGTGAMKCTPAHDPNDYQIAERHNLTRIICMNPDGTMNELAGDFAGMDRFDCRKALTKRIEDEGNLIQIETHIHQVGHSERTDVIVEPYLSKQWFVKMQPLANDVLDAQGSVEEKINFYPQRFEKTFTQWLENIEDWCISRQLWWGHRIPAWYHNETGEIYVGMDEPSDIENWTQDDDVLDTWFSSALWPFATLGWPNESVDFERFFPNNVLVTGYDIIFFWVARMAFSARYFTKKKAFNDVLIHGLIRDAQGRKMSKSLGNGIDPMDVIEKYGVDSLRFFLTTNSTPGQDLRYSEEKIEASWNFINKIWNASRFVMMNLEDDFNETKVDLSQTSLVDQWILTRFNETLNNINQNMEKYEFALVGNELYNFVWNDFCSWYIELSKAGLQSEDGAVKKATQSTLFTVLNGIVKMIHPFMPFVSEEIYEALNDEACCVANWPQAIANVDASRQEEMQQILSVISTIREVKATYNLKPSTPVNFVLADLSNQVIEKDEYLAKILERMAKAAWVETLEGELLVRPIHNGSISIPMGEIVNVEEEIKKLTLEETRLEKEILRANGMLANTNFISKAPQAKVDEETKKRDNYVAQLQIVQERLTQLKK